MTHWFWFLLGMTCGSEIALVALAVMSPTESGRMMWGLASFMAALVGVVVTIVGTGRGSVRYSPQVRSSRR